MTHIDREILNEAAYLSGITCLCWDQNAERCTFAMRNGNCARRRDAIARVLYKLATSNAEEIARLRARIAELEAQQSIKIKQEAIKQEASIKLRLNLDAEPYGA